MSKYHNRKIDIDGMTFDSMKEGNRYLELKMLQKAGEISGLKCQVKFDLIPAHKNIVTGESVRKMTYRADFVYYQNGQMIVEDVKGHKTKEYLIKRKLMSYYASLDPKRYQPITET